MNAERIAERGLHDPERQSVGGNHMIFTDFLKVRYRNKNIDDTTCERHYYQWVSKNSEFNDNGISHEATIKSIRNEVLNEWVMDSFDVEIEYGKTCDDPYSRRFDKYKEVFDNEIEQLANEYDLRIGKKGRGKVYTWETATYSKIWYDEDVHDLRSIETEFPAIVFNDALTSEVTLFYEPTVSPLNDNKIDFRISFDESGDEDYTPTVICFYDLDFFNDFENEFPAIVYNDALTSKLDSSTEPVVIPQHIDEFNLKDETSLSECDKEEQNVLYFNDIFPFNVIYSVDSKLDKDNDDDKIDIKQPSGDMSVKPLSDLINTDVGAYAQGEKIEAGTITTNLTARLPILNPADYDLWLMRIEQYFLMTDYSLWEVIKNGNKVLKRTVGAVEQEYEPTTAEEKQDRRNEIKARATLLMALLNKDQLKFHSYQDENCSWEQ
ncbi:hypothetical protein Tco_1002221 [Tanacetum coccineum]|uniref:Uncharacterized protein n=1 Tax=Tanacetum coccineum TaxID=301880 RepID=A0ABQ5F715_9ASTR